MLVQSCRRWLGLAAGLWCTEAHAELCLGRKEGFFPTMGSALPRLSIRAPVCSPTVSWARCGHPKGAVSHSRETLPAALHPPCSEAKSANLPLSGEKGTVPATLAKEE